MRAAPDGFVLTFMRDLNPATAGNPASYALESYTYEYHAGYGSKEMDKAHQRIVSAEVADARTVRVRVDALRTGDMGYVHELTHPGVRDAGGVPLVHARSRTTRSKESRRISNRSSRAAQRTKTFRARWSTRARAG